MTITSRSTFIRKGSALFFAALLLATQSLSITTAQAATKGWRYWGYFQAAPGASTWKAAMTGPTVDIEDGAVEGWSFVFSSDDVPSAAPSIKPDRKSTRLNSSH